MLLATSDAEIFEDSDMERLVQNKIAKSESRQLAASRTEFGLRSVWATTTMSCEASLSPSPHGSSEIQIALQCDYAARRS